SLRGSGVPALVVASVVEALVVALAVAGVVRGLAADLVGLGRGSVQGPLRVAVEVLERPPHDPAEVPPAVLERDRLAVALRLVVHGLGDETDEVVDGESGVEPAFDAVLPAGLAGHPLAGVARAGFPAVPRSGERLEVGGERLLGAPPGLDGRPSGSGPPQSIRRDIGDERGVWGDAGLAAVAVVAGGDEVLGFVPAAERHRRDVVDGQRDLGWLGAAVPAGVVVAAQDLVAEATRDRHQAPLVRSCSCMSARSAASAAAGSGAPSTGSSDAGAGGQASGRPSGSRPSLGLVVQRRRQSARAGAAGGEAFGFGARGSGRRACGLPHCRHLAFSWGTSRGLGSGSGTRWAGCSPLAQRAR